MKVIYVAGPYRSSHEWGVTNNIRQAELAALELWKMGYAVICPHKNTAYFGGAAPDSVWLEGDLEILRRCDAVYCLPSWRESSGARGEVDEAKRVGIPVFEQLNDCRSFLLPANQ
ncbi:MAG: DUF1937 family protein [Phycisphaerales bacterium]|nr:DUF1937 family protein [Phycisphaerales bacterium]